MNQLASYLVAASLLLAGLYPGCRCSGWGEGSGCHAVQGRPAETARSCCSSEAGPPAAGAARGGTCCGERGAQTPPAALGDRDATSAATTHVCGCGGSDAPLKFEWGPHLDLLLDHAEVMDARLEYLAAADLAATSPSSRFLRGSTHARAPPHSLL